ncbi:MAG TPA: exodeoxyribonuclease VII large subunit, partial [candidate division Zixibacteria bacterium]|nr:exodeoxyribonuclease VII large subunit [candidate division Zixibacteria bacterium]
HEIDTTLSDLAADLRAPTPSAAAELSIWDKEDFFQHIVDCLSQMEYSTSQIFKRYRSDLLQYMSRPVYQRPEGAVRDREQTLDNLLRHFENAGKNILEKKKNILSLSLSRLESLSPLAILKRGYAVIKKMPGGETVKSIGDLSGGDVIESVLKDGSVMALVKEIKQA